MKSSGVVISTENGKATVRFERQSSCGGNCASCAGCSYKQLDAEAENPLNASVGDRVTVETGSGKILRTAFLVYICPVIIFIAVYLISMDYIGESRAALLSIAAFFTFFVLLKKYDKKNNIKVRIVSIWRNNDESL